MSSLAKCTVRESVWKFQALQNTIGYGIQHDMEYYFIFGSITRVVFAILYVKFLNDIVEYIVRYELFLPPFFFIYY